MQMDAYTARRGSVMQAIQALEYASLRKFIESFVMAITFLEYCPLGMERTYMLTIQFSLQNQGTQASL